MIKASESFVYFALAAHLRSDRLGFQCSVATGGPWLADWTVHLVVPMSLAVLVIPTGVDHTAVASLSTWPVSSLGNRFPAVESQGRMVWETLLPCVLDAVL